jgi:hypothetical protein
LQDFHHAPTQFAYPPPQQHVTQTPGWATDFQRLNISNARVQRQQPQSQATSAVSSWHQDFMRQQTPASQPQNAYRSMSGYDYGRFAGAAFMPRSFQNAPLAQGPQLAQDAPPAFDEAAFEQAFQQAEAEQAVLSAPEYDRLGELDPLLARIRETRPGV